MGGLNIDAAIAAQNRQSTITELFARFEAAITSFSSFITEKFIESDTFKALETLGTKITESFALLFGPQEQDGSFKNASKGVSDFVATVDDWVNTNLVAPISTFVDEFTAHVQSGGAPIDFFKDKIRRAGNAIVDFFLGAVGENEFGEAGRGQRQGGLISKIGDGIRKAFEGEGVTKYLTDSFGYLMDAAYHVMLNFSGLDHVSVGENGLLGELKKKIFGEGAEENSLMANIMMGVYDGLSDFFNGPMGEDLKNTIGGYFKYVVDYLVQLIAQIPGSSLLGVDHSQIAQDIAGRIISGQGPVTSAGFKTMLENLPANRYTAMDLKSMVAEGSLFAENAPMLTNRVGFGIDRGIAMQNLARQAGDMSEADLIANFGPDYQMKLAQFFQTTQRRIGTLRATGKTTEPKDTTARIHAGERVLNPTEAASVNGLPQAMSQLNTLTAQIRDLMVQQNNLTSQVNRGVRGMSNDYLKGAMV